MLPTAGGAEKRAGFVSPTTSKVTACPDSSGGPGEMFVPAHGGPYIAGIGGSTLTIYSAAALRPIIALDGFDEFFVRCGLESNGAPDFDPKTGRLTHPLHGRIANRPAHNVELTVDTDKQEIALRGVVEETRQPAGVNHCGVDPQRAVPVRHVNPAGNVCEHPRGPGHPCAAGRRQDRPERQQRSADRLRGAGRAG